LSPHGGKAGAFNVTSAPASMVGNGPPKQV
jgi:hypothetical protein